jgi:hypothetical protein
VTSFLGWFLCISGSPSVAPEPGDGGVDIDAGLDHGVISAARSTWPPALKTAMPLVRSVIAVSRVTITVATEAGSWQSGPAPALPQTGSAL